MGCFGTSLIHEQQMRRPVTFGDGGKLAGMTKRHIPNQQIHFFWATLLKEQDAIQPIGTTGIRVGIILIRPIPKERRSGVVAVRVVQNAERGAKMPMKQAKNWLVRVADVVHGRDSARCKQLIQDGQHFGSPPLKSCV